MKYTNVLLGLLAALTTLAQLLPAQEPIAKGNWTVAGTGQVGTLRDIGSDHRTFMYDLSPRIGYFIARGLVLNFSLSVHRSSTEFDRSSGWAVGPGAMYYVRAVPRVYPYVSAQAMFTGDRLTGSNVLPFDIDRTSWFVSAGGLFMLVTHVGVSGEFYYQRDSYTISSTFRAANDEEFYGLRLGFAAFLF